MELQINDLVSSIKKDGIDAANAKADEIIANAKAQAVSIISEARDEAKRIKENNENEINTLKENARLSVEHSQRDAVILFKDSVKKEFEKLLAADVGNVVNTDALATLIKAALADEDPSKYAAEVSLVTDGLKSELAEEIKNGLEIKVSKNVRKGFRLAQKDGSGYFDCSDEEIIEMLKPFFRELII